MPRRPRMPSTRHERRHGQGSIQEISPGVFRAFKPPAKDAKRESKRFRTREAAHRWLVGEPEPTVLYVGPYLERWLGLRAPSLRGRSVQTYQQFLGYAEPIRGIPLAALTSDDCQAWLNGLLRTHTRYSVAVTRGIVSTAFRSAVPSLIPSNPLRETRLPKPDERPPRAWTHEQVGRLLAVAQGSHHAIWLAFAIGTGLRLGELRALEWSDLDLSRLTVRVSKSLDNNTNAEGPTKNGRQRIVDVPAELVPHLVEHSARQRVGDLLVFGHGGKPYRPTTYRNWLKRLCGRAGVPVLTPHSTRHTFCSLLLAANIPLPEIAHAMGHASITTTMTLYSWYITSDGRAAAMAIGKVLAGEMLRPTVQFPASTR